MSNESERLTIMQSLARIDAQQQERVRSFDAAILSLKSDIRESEMAAMRRFDKQDSIIEEMRRELQSLRRWQDVTVGKFTIIASFAAIVGGIVVKFFGIWRN